MTSRERWTVYPLLFLTLGMSLRDRLTGTFDARAVQCETLSVTDPSLALGNRALVGDVRCESLTVVSKTGKPIARLGTVHDDQGRLEFYNSDGKLVLGEGSSSDGKSGVLEIFSANGGKLLVLHETPLGGQLAALTTDANRKMVMTFGYEADGPGVFALLPNGKRFQAQFQSMQPAPKPVDPKNEPSGDKPATEEPLKNNSEPPAEPKAEQTDSEQKSAP